MKDLLLAYLGKTLNVSPDELAAKLYTKADDGTETQNEAALTELLQMDADRIQNLKGDTKTHFDKGYQKGQKEVAEKWEAKIRERATITDKTVIGDALLDAAFAVSDVPPEDKIKRSPAYINLERQLAEQAQTFEQQKEAAISEILKAQQKDKARAKAIETAKNEFMKMNPVLPEDIAKATNQVNLFLSTALNGLNFDLNDSGDITAIIEGDKRKEDGHGHAYTIERLVKESAEKVFDFRAQPDKGQAGNKNEPAPPRPAGSTDVPKTLQEYNDKILTITDPKEQAALTTAFLAASQQ